jgi:hypothetical protein
MATSFEIYPQFDITKQDFANMCLALTAAYNNLHGFFKEEELVTVEPEFSSKGGLACAFPRPEGGSKCMRFYPRSYDTRVPFGPFDGYTSDWDYDLTGMAGWLASTDVVIPFNMSYATSLRAHHGAVWTEAEIQVFGDVMTRFGFRCKSHPLPQHLRALPARPASPCFTAPFLNMRYRSDVVLEHLRSHNVPEPAFTPDCVPTYVPPTEPLLFETMSQLVEQCFTVCQINRKHFFLHDVQERGVRVVYSEKLFKKLFADVRAIDKKGNLIKFEGKWRRRRSLQMMKPQQYPSWAVQEAFREQWKATLRPGMRRLFKK